MLAAQATDSRGRRQLRWATEDGTTVHHATASLDRIKYRPTSCPRALASFFAVGAVCDAPRRNRMTVMSETRAFLARSDFDQPFSAASSDMSRASNRIGAAVNRLSVDIVSGSLPVRSSNRQQQKVDVANKCQQRVLASRGVAARPIFHAEFGRYLVELREQRGWSQSDAARFGEKHGLTRQILLHLEAGKTKDPEPSVLRAIATTYGAEYDDIARRFITYRYGIDFARVHTSADSAHQKKAPAVTPSVRDPEVKQEHPRTGGSLDAEPARHRLSEPEASLDAEVRRGIGHFERAIALELAGRLDASAATVRSVADALRATPPAAAPGGKQPAASGGRAPIRRAGGRRAR